VSEGAAEDVSAICEMANRVNAALIEGSTYRPTATAVYAGLIISRGPSAAITLLLI